jgi:hypothetical protein
MWTKPVVETHDAEEGDTTHISVLGVDLGIINIAVSLTDRFYSAGEFNHWYREYGNRRGSYRQAGTRWTHENVQQIGLLATDRIEQLLHIISNELVSFTYDDNPAERNLLDGEFRD